MIKLRGPGVYGSDFEKALFMSHVGPNVRRTPYLLVIDGILTGSGCLLQITECILNNRACFLEQPAWTTVLQSIVTDNPLVPERSTMLVSLLILQTWIPRLFKDITATICRDCDPPLATVADLTLRTRKLRESLKNWCSTYVEPDGSTSFRDDHYQIIVLYYICVIYSNRLSTSLAWTETADLEEMEAESQRFASRTVTLSNEEAFPNLLRSLLLTQKLPIAESMIETGYDWKQQLQHCRNQGPVFKMPKQTFMQWCDLLGRKTS